MNYLLDTHSLLWYLAGSPHLSFKSRRIIDDTSNILYVSVASLWEIAIKNNLGKLSLAQPFAVMFPQQLIDNSIDILPITLDHLALLTELPFHHRDPFDRLLVVQAMNDMLILISADKIFDAYGVKRI